jgi:hypothetical protein
VKHDRSVDDQRGDQGRRQRRPDHLELGVAVDRRAVEAILSWPHAPLVGREQHDRRDEHEDRHRHDDQHVVERVDRMRLRGCGRREPRDQEAEPDPQGRGHHTEAEHPNDAGSQ